MGYKAIIDINPIKNQPKSKKSTTKKTPYFVFTVKKDKLKNACLSCVYLVKRDLQKSDLPCTNLPGIAHHNLAVINDFNCIAHAQITCAYFIAFTI